MGTHERREVEEEEEYSVGHQMTLEEERHTVGNGNPCPACEDLGEKTEK